MSLNRTQRFALVFVNLALAISGTVSLHAQANLGSISGVVEDSSGAAVPNTPVTARSTSTKTETQVLTNANGMYIFPALQVGAYDLSVQVPGFKTVERSNVRVISSVRTTQDITLELGATTQSVKVVAAATVLDTSVTAVGTTRVVEEIQDLPLLMVGNQRSTVSFARTLPGVSWVPGVLDDGSQGINEASIYGAPEGGESYQIDGIMASVSGWGQLRDDFAPPPEMVEEMRLTTNTASEYGGQNSGVGVSLVFKSGTNTLHGNFWDYLRNDAMDSRNFFARDVTPNKQNEWGLTLGGPLVIPHVYNGKAKTFFFGMYSGFRLRNTPAGVTQSVPTAKMRGGDFSELLGAQLGTDALGRPILKGEIYDPATTRPGPNGTTIRDPFLYQGELNRMDPATFSSISSFFQKGYPLPTLPGIASNWVGQAIPSPTNADKGSIKIDHMMRGGSQRLSGTFQDWHRLVVFGGFFDPLIANTSVIDSPTWLARVSYQWTPSPNLVFNLRTAVNHAADRLGSFGYPADTYGAQSGLKGVFYPAVPPVSIVSMTGFGTNFGGQIYNPNWMVPVNGDLSWSKGSHSLKFGVQYVSQNFINKVSSNSTGTYNFSQRETALPGAPAGTGFGFASFLLGVVDTSTLNTPVDVRYGASAIGFYAQDSWRITPKLTMSYGLRWDVTLPAHEQYDRFSAFSKTVPNPAAGGRLGALTFWGDGPGRNGLKREASVYFKEWSPRLGFAYALTPKTLLRASYGLSSPAFIGTAGRGSPGTSGQANISVSPASLDAGVTPAFNWDNGFPTSFIPVLPSLNPSILNGSNVNWVVVDDVRPSRTQNISAGLERELAGGVLVKASYVGNLTHGLSLNALNINQMPLEDLSLGSLLLQSASSAAAQAAGIALPYPGFTGSVAQALRPYPQFGNVNRVLRPTGFNIYNAAEFTVQKHVGHGLSFLVSYTISKQLTNHPTFHGQGRANAILQYTAQLRQAKQLAELDRPQALGLSYIYELPVGPGKRFANTNNPVLKQMVGGWRVAGVQNYFSGTPVQLTTNQTLSGGYGALWANRVSGVPIVLNSCGSIDPGDPAKKSYLNGKAFADPAPFTLGNIRALGDVRTCGYLNENISLMKDFGIGERARIHFSADFNNVLNRHVWQGMGTNIDIPSQFGTFGAVGFAGGSGAANVAGGASDPRIIQLQLKVEF